MPLTTLPFTDNLIDGIHGDYVVGVPFSPAQACGFQSITAIAPGCVGIVFTRQRRRALRGRKLYPWAFRLLMQILAIRARASAPRRLGQAALGLAGAALQTNTPEVPARLHMHPLDMQHEILILLLTPHDPFRISGTDSARPFFP